MPIVYFAHGKESGPWGSKIVALAEVAKAKGYHVESPDYSNIKDADKRVEMLLGICGENGADVLVGSSMGGYVSTVASAIIKPPGLFLMAPAFYIPGYVQHEPVPCSGWTVIVHGWNDDVVPAANSIRFAENYKSELHLVNSGHRLDDQIPMLTCLFRCFLDGLRRQQ